jgi:hypothetical protein
LYDIFVVSPSEGEFPMQTRKEVEERLERLQRDYRGRRSILEMMQKGTTPEDLAKMRREQLDPIEQEIQKVKEELARNL